MGVVKVFYKKSDPFGVALQFRENGFGYCFLLSSHVSTASDILTNLGS